MDAARKLRKASDLEANPLSVKTPVKLANPPRRSSRRRAVMLSKVFRQSALKLRERGSDPPARTDTVLGPDEDLVAKSEMMLPEKYELLDKFFSSLDCSIRLLQINRYATMFTEISTQIRSLTDRRFTYSHLAQLKFIMPEAIVVEKVLRHDEHTCCMKPDLHITLDVKALTSGSKSKSLSRNLQLRKIFRDRLLDFIKSHPECADVPEVALPEPFGPIRANYAQPSGPSLVSEIPDVELSRPPLAWSHLPPSFKRHFSLPIHQESLKQEQSVASSVSECQLATSSTAKEEDSEVDAAKSLSELSLKSPGRENFSSFKVSFHETPAKRSVPVNDEMANNVLLKTPVQMASTPAKLMSDTPPMVQPSKIRCYVMSIDDNNYSSPSANNLLRRPPPNRPLKFDTPVKNKSLKVDDDEYRPSPGGDDILDILPQSRVQSIQEKERLALIEHDPAISQAKWRRRIISSLPKVFEVIRFLVLTIGRSVLTKEELIYKLICCQLDVVHRRDVEEQLRLLLELAHEWIHEKLELSGDLLVCVNKISSPGEIRMRLASAM